MPDTSFPDEFARQILSLERVSARERVSLLPFTAMPRTTKMRSASRVLGIPPSGMSMMFPAYVTFRDIILARTAIPHRY
jgi:hypothetical protein